MMIGASVKQGGKIRTAILASGLAIAALAGVAVTHQADARVVVGVGIGVPYAAPYPYPYYAPPPPVYYAPPPVYYAAPPPPVSYAAPAAQYWYYCDNPRGYYPTVPSCPTAWRQVAPQQ